MTIEYCSDEAFYDGILEMVKRGLEFKACYCKLTITLTGGY